MEQNRSVRNYTFKSDIAPNGFLGNETRKKCRSCESARIARSADYNPWSLRLSGFAVYGYADCTAAEKRYALCSLRPATGKTETTTGLSQ